MSNYLVTGSRGGVEHVTSDQARNFHAGIVGDGRYVMSGLTATMQSANTCRIAPGVACFNGADVEVPAGGADVTIENGIQGMKRNDLVVLRYSEDSGIESVDLTVIKGTPSASSPEDPAYNDGSILEGDDPVDMPLWRIPLDGVSVGTPEAMFDILVPMAEMQSDIDSLRDSVSQAQDDISQDASRTKSRTVCGSKIITGTGTASYVLLQKQELDSLARSVGARNSFPAVAATNGDWNSKNFLISGTLIQNNAVLIWLDRAVSGAFRINYAVTFPV